MALAKKATKPTGQLKRLLDTKKVDTRVVGPVERMLMAKDPTDGRRQDVLHPSELAKSAHCPLADYYRLVACDTGQTLPRQDPNRFRSEIIFSEGHEYHRKWQDWITELGVLEGMWLCPSCEHQWWDTSPLTCARCNHVGWKVPERWTNMVYREVPIASAKHRISGQADGKVGRSLLEVKSIGEGTIRIEAPALYKRHTKKIVVLPEDGDHLKGDLPLSQIGRPVAGSEPRSWVDMRALWDSVKRPFPSHLRQADIYMGVARISGLDIDSMTFIYENKANGGSKEFVVAYSAARSDALLDVALDIVWAVEKRRPPECPHGGCAGCRPYENLDATHEQDQTDTGIGEAGGERPLVRSAGAPRRAGLGAARAARGGLARAARGSDGAA